MADGFILFQVMNFDREEILYGTTSGSVEKAIEALAKDPRSAAREWKRGEVVSWKPITEPMAESAVRLLHREFETRTPPNKFKVLKTYVA